MTRRWLIGLPVGILLAVAGIVGQVGAAGEAATSLSIAPVETVSVGTVVLVQVTLTLPNGDPVADEPVALTNNGQPVRRTRTDLSGIAMFRLPRDLAPGEYTLVASYDGRSGKYLASGATATLVVVPYELAIRTVPELPGMVFALDGTRFVAGDDGVARIAVNVAGEHVIEVLVSEYRDAERLVEFSRWNTELFGPRISLRLPFARPLQAGFDISYRASQEFVDSEGGRVDPSRVTSIEMRSSLGTLLTFPDGEARWYKSSRAVRRPEGLESVDIRYNVDKVIVDGSNVVNSGQQRFLVEPNDEWTIELLLYSATFAGRDLLFGFPIGQAINLTYPDGRVVRIESSDGQLAARWLARGIYRVNIADAPGWAPVMPVALSKDQDVQLQVVSFLDFALGILAAIGIAVGLLHVGRPHLVPKALGASSGLLGRVAGAPRRLAGRLGPPRPVPTRAMATPTAEGAMPRPITSDPATSSLLPAVRPRASLSAAPSTPVPPPWLVVMSPPAPGEPSDPADSANVPEPADLADSTAPGTDADAAAPEAPPPVVTGDRVEGGSRAERSPSRKRGVSKKAPSAGRPEAATARSRGGEPSAPLASGGGSPSELVMTADSSNPLPDATARPAKARAARARKRSPESVDDAEPANEAKAASARATRTRGRKGTAGTARKGRATKGAAKKRQGSRSAKDSEAESAATGTTAAAPRKRRASRAVDSPRTGSDISGLTPRKSRTHNRDNTKQRGSVTAPRAEQVDTPAAVPIPIRPQVMPQEVAYPTQLSALGLDNSSDGGPTPITPRPAPPPRPTDDEIAACRACGFPMWVGARYCRRCGRPLDSWQSVAAAPAVVNGEPSEASPRLGDVLRNGLLPAPRGHRPRRPGSGRSG